MTITVGAGGSAGTASPTAGGAGGASSVTYTGTGVVCQVAGGSGGAGSSSGAAAGGAASGNGTAYTLSASQYALLQGQEGATAGGAALSIGSVFLPAQGGVAWGRGVPLIQGSGTLPVPSFPGAGGYGGASNVGSTLGGAGAPGYARIEF
jgi:hypothetical protein